MYWPIGPARAYSATNRHLLKERTTISDDEVKEAITSGQEDSNANEQDGRLNSTGQDDQDNDSTKVNGERHTENGSNIERGANVTLLREERDLSGEIIGVKITRNGQMFGTITPSTLTVWQTKTYGPNTALLIRPDSGIYVVQTSLGYLITYSLATDSTARVYRTQFSDGTSGHNRRQSIAGYHPHRQGDANAGPGEGSGVREASLRFRMAIKIDAGINKALALDNELIVATVKPAAIQLIRWSPSNEGPQTSTELISRMSWISNKSYVVDMVHDRPMNLSTWVTGDGKAYAIQRRVSHPSNDPKAKESLFQGYGFHNPQVDDLRAVKTAINARFSLIAVACENGDIYVYMARDYAGHIPISHTLRPNITPGRSGKITFLTYSPDGYCLFAGYEKGWTSWSVFGKPGANSFASDRSLSEHNDDGWLLGVRDGFWVGGGSQLLLLGKQDNRLWILDMARSAVSGCYSSANVARSLMQTDSGFMIYRGYDVSDLTTISGEISLWHHVQVPAQYLIDQWPVRSTVTSPDGRYVAVAGRRGLAHYSVNSGRWKTFEDSLVENSFTVRGGMCWHDNILIAAIESNSSHELRLFSRELPLDMAIYIERLASPIVLIAPSGEDSLLVYTYENILFHYVITTANNVVKLVQVGQIALHGIIRAPPRVRAVSWILPEDQLHHGDPSQDVAKATIIFLVDGKLVLLHPILTEKGDLKYEMRIIAHNVEYYALMRDQPSFILGAHQDSLPSSPSVGVGTNGYQSQDLRDSLWFFDGDSMRVWLDVQDVLASASVDLGRDLPATVKVNVDFYPLSTLLNKGILFGVESELVQRRHVSFAFLRFATRHLPYFSHALEVLLHDVLDEEVDSPPIAEQALLPTVLSFLSSFPQYLDIVVQCTRKTEELFEESLRKGSLKTAGGYLLVLHTFEDLSSSSHQSIRLLQRAKNEGDWDLCKELARFLMALDESGTMLRDALGMIESNTPAYEQCGGTSIAKEDNTLNAPKQIRNGFGLGIGKSLSFPYNGLNRSRSQSPGSVVSNSRQVEASIDYFSAGTRYSYQAE
ncbi:hypothetical protein M501DRAFT_988532 [Patellaria atrata CBS 101060]|uniref:Ribosome control protein 1 domain-containing protein n=1 Tax=Patellaria atrata CBS 101060 TaxID=1346257 RepID=A0A9P4VW31_9PEZI|nr:hypothetical protein M501DRAFT_988532 [Patellaria atrata CBS 101060]